VKKKTQKDEIRHYLNCGNSLTALEALNMFGSMRLAAVIHDLKHNDGMGIVSEEITTANGKKIARYKATSPEMPGQFGLFK